MLNINIQIKEYFKSYWLLALVGILSSLFVLVLPTSDTNIISSLDLLSITSSEYSIYRFVVMFTGLSILSLFAVILKYGNHTYKKYVFALIFTTISFIFSLLFVNLTLLGSMSVINVFYLVIIFYVIYLIFFPVIKHHSDVQRRYLLSLSTNILISGVITLIVYVCLTTLWSFAIQLFWGFNNQSTSEMSLLTKIYLLTSHVISFIIFPNLVSSFLHIDAKNAFHESKVSGFIRKIFQLIFTPFSFLFLFIYILYIIFSLLNKGNLPDNQLLLISTISIILNLFVIFSTRLQENKYSKFITYLMCFLNIIPISTFFLAIYLRINDFGFTLDRTLTIYLGFFFVILNIVAIVSKKPNWVASILSSYLFVIIGLFVLPVFGAIDVSKYSQIDRFRKVTNNYQDNFDSKVKLNSQAIDIVNYLSINHDALAELSVKSKYDIAQLNSMLWSSYIPNLGIDKSGANPRNYDKYFSKYNLEIGNESSELRNITLDLKDLSKYKSVIIVKDYVVNNTNPYIDKSLIVNALDEKYDVKNLFETYCKSDKCAILEDSKYKIYIYSISGYTRDGKITTIDSIDMVMLIKK